MMHLLDPSQATDISFAIREVLTEAGYSAEEAIPGYIQAAIDTANDADVPEQLLDEAADFLADGGVHLDDDQA